MKFCPTACAVALAVLVGISGCSWQSATSVDDAGATTTASDPPTSNPSAADTAAPTPPVVEPSRPPQADHDDIEVPDLGKLGDEYIYLVVDGGKQFGAKGKTTVDDNGVPVSYTVASGDTWVDVKDRFGMRDYFFINLNSVRRNRTFDLYVGDVLNLDPHTITSVGSQNGTVYSNPLVTPHPKQH